MGMHAFYSKKQENNSKEIERNDEKGNRKRNIRYNIYLTEDGEERIVTEVSKNSDRISSHANAFPDSEYLGIVTEWNRVVYWE